MSKGVRLTFMFSCLLLAFILFCYPIALKSENVAKGNIVGFVYDMDGTTPLEGAVVKVKNISTDVVYESTKSDILGIFKIKGLENGIYLYGVMTPNGDFNSDGLVGIRIQGNETAKMSISLTQQVIHQIMEPLLLVLSADKPRAEDLQGWLRALS